MVRSFGPNVEHNDDGTLRATCNWCCFRVGSACTHVKPTRQIPDPSDTPDWCEMKAGMLRDVAEMVAKGKNHA